MKNLHPLRALLPGALCLAVSFAAKADTTVTVDPGTLTSGYMNVFNLPSAGGAFQFGSGWGIADLTASFSGSVLTLGPNQIGDPDPYWYTPSGGPGATGNKIMDANLYNETTGTYVGETLTFAGTVLANSLAGQAAQGNGVVWTSVAFIKDFAPDYSSFVSVTAPLTAGAFSIDLLTSADPGHHIQYGFETIGSDIWATDVGSYGTIVIAPVPEPSLLSLAGLGGAAALAFVRRRDRR